MRSARSWRILIFLCLFLEMYFPAGVHSYAELKMAKIQKNENGIHLHFPCVCEQEEKLLIDMLYHTVLHLSDERQEALSFVQNDTAFYLPGKERIASIIRSEVKEGECCNKKELALSKKTASERVHLEDVNREIKLGKLPLSFITNDDRDFFCNEEKSMSNQVELGEEESHLIFVNDEGIYPFYDLRFTSDDGHNISKLIKNMADLSLWELLKKSKEMKKLGRKIEPVHPFRFLGYIYSTPDLKKRLPKIKDSHFKWNKFMEGLCERLSREALHNNLNRFIPGFAQIVECSETVIEDFVRRHDWHGMLEYLM